MAAKYLAEKNGIEVHGGICDIRGPTVQTRQDQKRGQYRQFTPPPASALPVREVLSPCKPPGGKAPVPVPAAMRAPAVPPGTTKTAPLATKTTSVPFKVPALGLAARGKAYLTKAAKPAPNALVTNVLQETGGKVLAKHMGKGVAKAVSVVVSDIVVGQVVDVGAAALHGGAEGVKDHLYKARVDLMARSQHIVCATALTAGAALAAGGGAAAMVGPPLLCWRALLVCWAVPPGRSSAPSQLISCVLRC